MVSLRSLALLSCLALPLCFGSGSVEDGLALLQQQAPEQAPEQDPESDNPKESYFGSHTDFMRGVAEVIAREAGFAILHANPKVEFGKGNLLNKAMFDESHAYHWKFALKKYSHEANLVTQGQIHSRCQKGGSALECLVPFSEASGFNPSASR